MVVQILQEDARVILKAMVQAEDTVLRDVATVQASDLLDVKQVVAHLLLVNDRAEGEFSLVVTRARAITVLRVNEDLEGELVSVLNEESTNVARLTTCQQ